MLLSKLKHGLIVSCQAEPGTPLYGAIFMAAMARAAAMGGAVGIRANGPEDIAAIKAAVDLPVIGIYKVDLPGFAVRISPTVDHALQVTRAGADILALDATHRPHPDGLDFAERLHRIRASVNLPIMADISTYEEGLAAQADGADLVGTTLSGYTSGPVPDEPDFDLLRQLADHLRVPIVAEGRISTPDQAARALALGAFAVVVGSAITRPHLITAQFISRMQAP
jgi:N-acylglucosamine-6-phosphate 2-epimerase